MLSIFKTRVAICLILLVLVLSVFGVLLTLNNNQSQTVVTLQADLASTSARLLMPLSLSMRDTNWSLSALLAIEAYKVLPSEETEQNLLYVSYGTLGTMPHLVSSFGHGSNTSQYILSPDQKMLVVGTMNGSIIRWNLKTEKMILPILGDIGEEISFLIFSPDGKYLVSNQRYDGIKIWDAHTGEIVWVINNQDSNLESAQVITFTADSKMLWIVDRFQKATLWSLNDRKAIREIDIDISDSYYPNIQSADGTLFVHFSNSHEKVLLSRTSDLSKVDEFVVDDTTLASSVGFSSDQKSLAVTLMNKASISFRGIVVWDVPSHKIKLQMLTPPREDRLPTLNETFFQNAKNYLPPITNTFLSPDATRFATFSTGLSVWDITGSEPVRPNDRSSVFNVGGLPTVIASMVFGSDLVAFNQMDETVILKPSPISDDLRNAMQGDQLVDFVCGFVGRNLSGDEWLRYMGEEPYHKTCDQWSVMGDYVSYQVRKAASMQPLQASDQFSYLVSLATEIPDPIVANYLCNFGSVFGHASIVMPACDYGVEIMPYAAASLDTRGLARALTGDVQGAITDFQYLVDFWENTFLQRALVKQRKEWIRVLKAGQNPFTEEVMKQFQEALLGNQPNIFFVIY